MKYKPFYFPWRRHLGLIDKLDYVTIVGYSNVLKSGVIVSVLKPRYHLRLYKKYLRRRITTIKHRNPYTFLVASFIVKNIMRLK